MIRFSGFDYPKKFYFSFGQLFEITEGVGRDDLTLPLLEPLVPAPHVLRFPSSVPFLGSLQKSAENFIQRGGHGRLSG